MVGNHRELIRRQAGAPIGTDQTTPLQDAIASGKPIQTSPFTLSNHEFPGVRATGNFLDMYPDLA